MRLVILICARDEEVTIGEVITANRTAVEGFVQSVEVVVVDDRSTDETAAVAVEQGARVVPVEEGEGLANAFRIGVAAALDLHPSHLAHTDADGQYGSDSLLRLCERAAEGVDLVVGDRLWRRPPGMSDFRYVWNQRLSDLVTLLSGEPVPDAQSGCRLFSRATAEAVPLRASFTYTQEQLIRAARSGCSIGFVPVEFGPRSSGRSRLVKSPLNYLAHVLADLDSLAAELEIDLEGMEFIREP